RVVRDQQHPGRGSAERFGAEVLVGRRLVGDPERGVAHRELSDNRFVLVGTTDPVILDGPKSRLVELDRGAATPHRELSEDAGHWLTCSSKAGLVWPTSSASISATRMLMKLLVRSGSAGVSSVTV